jgi:hypothetical protein
MRRCILLATVAACNQVYGLDATVIVDAPAPDAPPACSDELMFRPQLQQIVLQPCVFYSIAADTNRAFAFCRPPGTVGFLAEGPVDGPLTELAVADIITAGVQIPIATPEGDRLILSYQDLQGPPMFGVYARRDDTWQRQYTLPMSIDFDDNIGAPSRRPDARILHARPNAAVVDEYVEDAPDSWRLLRSHSPMALGTSSLYSQFNLTPDGLHVVFRGSFPDGTVAVFHAARASRDRTSPINTSSSARTPKPTARSSRCSRPPSR